MNATTMHHHNPEQPNQPNTMDNLPKPQNSELIASTTLTSDANNECERLLALFRTKLLTISEAREMVKAKQFTPFAVFRKEPAALVEVQAAAATILEAAFDRLSLRSTVNEQIPDMFAQYVTATHFAHTAVHVLAFITQLTTGKFKLYGTIGLHDLCSFYDQFADELAQTAATEKAAEDRERERATTEAEYKAAAERLRWRRIFDRYDSDAEYRDYVHAIPERLASYQAKRQEYDKTLVMLAEFERAAGIIANPDKPLDRERLSELRAQHATN
jgi:hypothetical protein